MIAIDNPHVAGQTVLVSDEVVETSFVCDLIKCKGGCCEDGDAGAPLETEELNHLLKFYDVIKQYMTAEGIKEVEKAGKYIYDKEFGWVTPTVKSSMCAYGYRDKQGIIKCAIEQAFNDEKINWKKPLSCHLFPIRVSASDDAQTAYVNYEPRQRLCNPACKLGKKLKVPTYVFLKEALVRKYGEEFYEALDATANHLQQGEANNTTTAQ